MANSHGSQPHAHSVEDVKKHVKVYILIFLALLAGTIITVSMYYVHFNSMTLTITIALFIATVKALLVAGFFMHLISERKAIYSTLAVTGFFFAAMLYLFVLSRHSVPAGTEFTPTKYVPIPMANTGK
jgi:cytochrome c oxidase subunit 4